MTRTGPARTRPGTGTSTSTGSTDARRRSTRARGRARATAALGLAALFFAADTQGAAAHVLLETATPNGDGTTTLTFSFEHGCDGAPTTGLAVTLPEGVEAISTVQPEGWAAEQGQGVVRWEGTPVADGTTARFELVATVTGSVGQAFVFPTTQACTEGSYDWVDTDPGDGHPAPSFIATTATLAPQRATAGPTGPTPDGGASLAQTLAAIGAASLATATAGTWWSRRRHP